MCIHDFLHNLHDAYRRAGTNLFNHIYACGMNVVQAIQLKQLIGELHLFIKCCLDIRKLIYCTNSGCLSC